MGTLQSFQLLIYLIIISYLFGLDKNDSNNKRCSERTKVLTVVFEGSSTKTMLLCLCQQ